MPLSDDDIQRFWFHRIRDVVTGADRGAAFHLAQARGDAIRARVAAETSLAIVKELANRPSDVLAPAEIDAIAAEVAERVNTEAIAEAAADELAERLAE